MVFSVSDVTGIAGFVGFDKEVAKLTHVLASEAAQIVVGLIGFRFFLLLLFFQL